MHKAKSVNSPTIDLRGAKIDKVKVKLGGVKSDKKTTAKKAGSVRDK